MLILYHENTARRRIFYESFAKNEKSTLLDKIRRTVAKNNKKMEYSCKTQQIMIK